MRSRYLNFEEEAPRSVAQVAVSIAAHLGEPAWTDFIRELTEGSEDFARMWALHDVARPGVRIKHFLDPARRFAAVHHDELRGHRDARVPHHRLHPGRRRDPRASAADANQLTRTR